MVANLWSLLGPVLLIGGFYSVLGLVVWAILRPGHLRLPRPASDRLTRLVAEIPVERAVLRQALWLATLGLVGLLIPVPSWLRLLAAQAVAAAVLLILLDRNQRRHDEEQANRQLLASLRQADAAGWLAGGSLAGQDLRRVQWAGTQLGGADLRGSNLAEADLQNADLRAANLAGCVLDGACLGKTDLTGAGLTGASLMGAQAKAAVLAQADLRNANLEQARLADADMTAAQLDGANLAGAGLKGARLDRARLTGARYDETTRWPKRFDPVQAGALPEKSVAPSPNDPEHLREPLR